MCNTRKYSIFEIARKHYGNSLDKTLKQLGDNLEIACIQPGIKMDTGTTVPGNNLVTTWK
jgi:hypothetical protein